MKNVHKSILFLLLCTIIVGFRPDHDPMIFLIGDSISIGYGNYLKHDLDGKIILERKADGGASKNLDDPIGANGGDSRMVLSYLTEKVKDPSFHPDYLLLNCGLHDVKHDTKSGKIAVEPEEYQRNLQSIFRLVTGKGIKLIWVTTTEVVDSIHNKNGIPFYRYAKDVAHYNRLASDYWKSKQVPEIDLYAFTKAQRVDRFKDHVHYHDDICALQGAFIAGNLLQIIHPKANQGK